ncbi:PE-PPE domain-containing protein [Mycobacterium sp. pV006]|uniref:PE-PPE domain-containing protein n=1 Tax=Mycobacterium sp. pV006 TaxID=3238983 RepID=UPI00351BAC76
MGSTMRKAGMVAGATVASVAVALGTATGGGAASTALIIGGIGQPTMPDLLMAPVLGGAFWGQERINVQWPAQAAPFTKGKTLGASVNEGAENMKAAIKAALENLTRDENGNVLNGEKVTVVGLSGGSLVVDEVLRELSVDANAPSKEHIEFVLIADSSRQKIINRVKYNSRFDYTYQPAANTPYNTVVVTGEYDGMADFPDRWWNFLALMNAVAGAIVMHIPSAMADLSKVPEANITREVNEHGGITTHYLVPAKTLPLVLLIPSLKPREAELKARIDKGYSRNDDKVAAARKTAEISEVPASVSSTLVSTEAAAPVTEKSAAPVVADVAESDDDSVTVEKKAVSSKRSSAKVSEEVEVKVSEEVEEASNEVEDVKSEVKEIVKAEAEEAKAADAAESKADTSSSDRAGSDNVSSDESSAVSESASSQSVGSSDSKDSTE